MNNAAILRALPQLKSLKGDLKDLDSEIAGLEAQVKGLVTQRAQLSHEIDTLTSVSAIIDGIAVSYTAFDTSYGNDYRINTVDREIGRSAEVYTNAHTSKDGVAKDWCVKLRSPHDEHGRNVETWLGDGWPYRDAVEAAKRWAVHGEVLSHDQQALAKTRHRLDPDGRAPKRRRLAFEAAWLAGNKKLAEEILLGKRRATSRTTESTTP